MADISEAVCQLAEAVKEMRVDWVPPPVVFVGCQGQIDIVSFFTAFERYCLVLYKKRFNLVAGGVAILLGGGGTCYRLGFWMWSRVSCG